MSFKNIVRFEMRVRTERQRDRLIATLRSPTGGKGTTTATVMSIYVVIIITLLAILWMNLKYNSISMLVYWKNAIKQL